MLTPCGQHFDSYNVKLNITVLNPEQDGDKRTFDQSKTLQSKAS